MNRLMKCACCGGGMFNDKDIGDSIIFKCRDCGLTNTILKGTNKDLDL